MDSATITKAIGEGLVGGLFKLATLPLAIFVLWCASYLGVPEWAGFQPLTMRQIIVIACAIVLLA